MRHFLNERGALEVDNNLCVTTYSLLCLARPFVTHHNALDIPSYLRIANELYLKRLIIMALTGYMNSAAILEMKGWTERIILNLPFLNGTRLIKIISG